MARRIILGKNGANVQFRVSAPGFDAATAPLDALLFDGDNVPARVAAQGEFRAAAGSINGVASAQAHGVPGVSLCIAIARPWEIGAPGDWYYFLRLSNGSVTGGRVGKDIMDKNYCTPFYWWADQTTGATEVCGWRFSWDSGQVIATNFTPYPLDVRWAALEY